MSNPKTKIDSGKAHEDEPAAKLPKIEQEALLTKEAIKTDADIFRMNSQCSIQSPKRAIAVSVAAPAAVPQSIKDRLIDRGFEHSIGDHPLGVLVLKSAIDDTLLGAIVVGAVGIPGLSLCKAKQVGREGQPLYKMSFASKAQVDFFLSIEGFIEERFKDTGFFGKVGYAIGSCSTLCIQRCSNYFNGLNLEASRVNELFPIGGARIAPQPTNLAEEQIHRQELLNTINYIRSFNGLMYHVEGKSHQDLTIRVRVEVEEMLIPDCELLEKLLCYRVLESIPVLKQSV
jgi:hypothetical protein